MSQVVISQKRKPRRASQKKSLRDILPKPHNGMLTEKEREKLLRYVESLTVSSSPHLE
jgi:hypothetical protein